MKGKFTVELKDHDSGEVLDCRTMENTFVNDGKEFTLDVMFGARNWHDPDDITGPNQAWSDMTSRYVAIGSSTNTNDAVPGPTTGSGVDPSGPWQGVDPEDSRLSSETARKQAAVARSLGSLATTVYATFGDPELGTGQVDISEMGIFLGSAASSPAGDPTMIESYRPQAMICRSVLYTLSGSQWYADPITRVAGSDITITHTFGDLEY